MGTKMLFFTTVFCKVDVEQSTEDAIVNEQSNVEVQQSRVKEEQVENKEVAEKEEEEQVAKKEEVAEKEQVAEKEEVNAEEVTTEEKIPSANETLDLSTDSGFDDEIESAKDFGRKLSKNPFEKLFGNLEQSKEFKKLASDLKLDQLDLLGGDRRSKRSGHSHEREPAKEETALDKVKSKINKKKAKKSKQKYGDMSFEEFFNDIFGELNSIFQSSSGALEEDAVR